MNTATARRLDQVTQALGPTEAIKQWLATAYAFGSLGAYIAWASAEQDRNPLISLPIQMIRAVKEAGKGQSAANITETVDRAVKEVLLRCYLVQQVNDHLQRGRFGDEVELELLRETLPLALTKNARPERRPRWRTRATRLRQETFTWERASEVLARRFFGGASACFPDLREHLDDLARELDGLLDRWNAQVPAEERIDLHLLASQAQPGVAPLLQRALTDARHATLVFLGERNGEFRVERFVEYAELLEGRP
jgi:hypothetical protein